MYVDKGCIMTILDIFELFGEFLDFKRDFIKQKLKRNITLGLPTFA